MHCEPLMVVVVEVTEVYRLSAVFLKLQRGEGADVAGPQSMIGSWKVMHI